MQIITTNVVSIKSINNLNASSADMATSFERLSTGKRINSAVDDAAGIAIASRMQSELDGLGVAERNITDAISFLGVAENGAKSQVEILQRMRELAVNAANGVLGEEDRDHLNKEFMELLQETDIVARETDFNGHRPLNGSVAIGASQTLTNQPWSESWTHTIVSDGAGGAKVINELGDTITSFHSHNDPGFLNKVANNHPQIGNALGGTIQHEAILDSLNGCSSVGHNGSGGGGYANGYIYQAPIPPPPNNVPWVTGGHHNFNITGTIPISEIGKTFSITYSGNNITGHLEGPDKLIVQTGAYGGDKREIGLARTTNIELGIDTSNILTVNDARDALDKITNAIDTITHERIRFGKHLNVLETVYDNVQTKSVNTASSRSRIEDTDYAIETAKLTSRKILHEAGMSMVSQANSIPQRVLSLLK